MALDSKSAILASIAARRLAFPSGVFLDGVELPGTISRRGIVTEVCDLADAVVALVAASEGGGGDGGDGGGDETSEQHIRMTMYLPSDVPSDPEVLASSLLPSASNVVTRFLSSEAFLEANGAGEDYTTREDLLEGEDVHSPSPPPQLVWNGEAYELQYAPFEFDSNIFNQVTIGGGGGAPTLIENATLIFAAFSGGEGGGPQVAIPSEAPVEGSFAESSGNPAIVAGADGVLSYKLWVVEFDMEVSAGDGGDGDGGDEGGDEDGGGSLEEIQALIRGIIVQFRNGRFDASSTVMTPDGPIGATRVRDAVLPGSLTDLLRGVTTLVTVVYGASDAATLFTALEEASLEQRGSEVFADHEEVAGRISLREFRPRYLDLLEALANALE